MPFDEGSAIDEWDVVEVDYLEDISTMAGDGRIARLTRRRSSNFGCAFVSSAPCTAYTDSSYAAVLGDWDNRELCREGDGTPKRGHGSPKACMVKGRERKQGVATTVMAFHTG